MDETPQNNMKKLISEGDKRWNVECLYQKQLVYYKTRRVFIVHPCYHCIVSPRPFAPQNEKEPLPSIAEKLEGQFPTLPDILSYQLVAIIQNHNLFPTAR
jgi:hypothetical protein